MNRTFHYVLLTAVVILVMCGANQYGPRVSMYDEVFQNSIGNEYIGTYTLGVEWETSKFGTCDGKYLYSINHENFPGFDDHPKNEPYQTSAPKRFLRVRAEAIGATSAGTLFPERFDAEMKIYEVYEASRENIFDCIELSDQPVSYESDYPRIPEPPSIDTSQLVNPVDERYNK